MKWNEYAKVGDALIKAFRQAVRGKVTECDFAFEILDRLKMEDGYKLVAFWDDKEYWLYAVPVDEVDLLWDFDPDDLVEGEEYYLWNHLSIEKSAMGAWQATLLGDVQFGLPSIGWPAYDEKKFIFSTAALSSLKKKGTFDYKTFIGDSRIVPSVEMKGAEAVVRHCYWNDWQGLIVCTDNVRFDSDGSLVHSGRDWETLFKYDCGETISDFDNSRLSLRLVSNEDGTTSVQALIRRERGGSYYKTFGSSSDEGELRELEDEAAEWIEDYDDFMRDITGYYEED